MLNDRMTKPPVPASCEEPGPCAGRLHILRPFTRALLIIALLLALPVAPAVADDDDRITIDAVFGFGGHIPAERWAPATIYIHSRQRSISGTMLIEYAQDTFQQAQIAMPFAAAAGVTAAHQAVISLPQGQDQGGGVRITLLDERGRRLATMRFSTFPDARAKSLGLVREYGDPLLVTIGLPRFVEAMRAIAMADRETADREAETRPSPGRQNPQTLASRWANTTVAIMPPGDLPLTPIAWDGAAALIVSGDAVSQLSRPVLDAIHRWVLSGGRLVIVADRPGEQWRTWLPPEASAYVHLAPPEHHPLPAGLADLIEHVAQGTEDVASEVTGERLAPIIPVDGLPQRLIHITDEARHHGWISRLPLDAPEAVGEVADAQPGETGPSALAEGPVGFGFVTIIGFDPHRTTTVLSSQAAGAVWRQALLTIATDFFASTERIDETWGWGATGRAQRAVNASLESLASVPVLGYGSFLLIAGAIVLLAILVGPFDYLILRRRRALQRSWMTALVWIALASIIAIAAPRIVRTDPSQVNRLAVIDQIQHADGSLTAFNTALTGIYAGHAGTARLTDVDPASWWRGISAETYFFNRQRGSSLAPTIQAAAGGDLGALRGNAVHALPMAQWTFRTFLERAADTAPVTVTRPADPADGLIAVTLPSGVEVTQSMLQTARGSYPYPLRPASSDGDGTIWLLARRIDTLKPQDGLLPEWVFDASEVVPWRAADFTPGAALALPGPDRRALAFQSRVNSGHWAVLYLRLEGLPAYPSLDIEANHAHSAIVRILVPMPEGSEP